MGDRDDQTAEGRLRALVWAGADVVFRMSPDWRRILRLEGVGFLGGATDPDESWADRYIYAGDRPDFLAAVGRAARAGSPFEREHRVVRTDGSVGWALTRAVPILDGRPGVAEWLAAASDVTARKEGEAALQAAEGRLRLALSAARIGAWSWDVAGDSHRRDASLNTLLGLPPEDTVGPIADFLAHVHPGDREAVRAAFDQSVRRGRPLNVEFRVVWPDGSVRWLRDKGDVFGEAGRARMTGVCVDFTDLKGAEEALQRTNDELESRVAERTSELVATLDSLQAETERRRGLARELATAQEDERKRVARDIHHTVGQLLAGLSLTLKAVELAGEIPPQVAGKLAESQVVLDSLGRELHGLAVRLRPTSLDDLGLEPALRQLVAEWSSRAGVHAEFQAAGLDAGRLTPEVETTLYRVVQEALTNAGRHARARVVSVVVSRTDGHVLAVVEDDGAGFDPNDTPRGRLGLKGMRERIALVGGDLEIESAPGSGTSIYARIPLPDIGD